MSGMMTMLTVMTEREREHCTRREEKDDAAVGPVLQMKQTQHDANML